MSNKTEPLNTAPIQNFIQQVKSADASKSKEIKIDLQNAKRLAFCLGEVMSRLNGELEELLYKQPKNSKNDTIEIRMDGGTDW